MQRYCFITFYASFEQNLISAGSAEYKQLYQSIYDRYLARQEGHVQ